MNTPIVDFVKKYADSNALRLHMPGHKGNGPLGFEKCDITEIVGADVLYGANGIIDESQRNASNIFGTQKTFYSTEGSSLCIRAMLYLIKSYALEKGVKPFVAAGRNAHKTFVTACSLLSIDVDWLLPKDAETIISCNITDDFLESYLKNANQKPVAVYITSPDYLGNVSDIKALSRVCKKYGVLLIVDNAHGAYLNFLPQNAHPISLGADMCCDSAHKTLPVLTGGAYLHVSSGAHAFFADGAQNALSIFASTSPSYLILQSIDAANKYVTGDYRDRLSELVKRVNTLKSNLLAAGYTICGNEPIKITIAPKQYGYTGLELADLLFEKNIVCEFSDPDFLVLMLTPEIGGEGIRRLESALLEIPKKNVVATVPPRPTLKKKNKSLSETLYESCELLGVEDCLGKTLCRGDVACPPAIPIVLPGEIIDKNAIESFKYYGVAKCWVIK